MLLQEKSEEFKQIFLLVLTKELIKNSIPESLAKLEVKEEIKKDTIKKEVKKVIKEYEKPLKASPIKQLQAIQQGFKPLPKPFGAAPRRRLLIPKPRLPQRLQYIRPAPAQNQLDLGKLNEFVQDPTVQAIECDGPDTKITIRTPVEKRTEVILTGDEIDNIIYTFAKAAKIPVAEGIFRVAVGRLILSAIVSNVVGSKFIIKKMRFVPPPQARLAPPQQAPSQAQAQQEEGFIPSQ